MAKKILEYGGRGVAVALLSVRTPGPDTVYWSSKTADRNGGNSFVIVHDEQHGDWTTRDGRRVALISINGGGEIRWKVSNRPYDHRNAEGAIEHFELTPMEES